MTPQSPRSAIDSRSCSRATYLDLARGVAIVLALASHWMVATRGWDLLNATSGSGYGVARLVTRTATPTFILLFGASLELSAVRRWAEDPATQRKKFVRRAARCYAHFAVVALAALVGGFMGAGETLRALTLQGRVFIGDIYVFYVFAMLAMILVIPFRRRFGLPATLVITLAWWPTALALKPLAPQGEGAAVFTSRIFGIGDQFGPSVFHALGLLAAGMVLGRLVLEVRRSPMHLTPSARILAGLIALAAGFIALAIMSTSPAAVLGSFVRLDAWRYHNHPGYYALGLLAALGVIGAATAVVRLAPRLGHRPGPFGGSSLTAFTAGNVLVCLLAPALGQAPPLALIAASGSLLIAALWCALRSLQSRRTAADDRSVDGAAA